MRSLILILCLLFTFSIGQTQDDPIKITSEKNENIILIYAENTSEDILNVELNITSTGFKHTRECPIVETIHPGEKMQMTTLIAKKNEKASYSIDLKYSVAHKKSKPKVLLADEANIDLSKGVFVFSKDGCGRCKTVEKYLDEHNIQYTKLNITKKPEDASLMWQKLIETGYEDQYVQTPVIIVDGVVHFNKPDYKPLLKELTERK